MEFSTNFKPLVEQARALGLGDCFDSIYVATKLHANLVGKLHLRLGPMSSGKTSQLIAQYLELVAQKIPCLVIRSQEDQRSASGTVESLGGAKAPCISLGLLMRDPVFLVYLARRVQVIFLDEAQFFGPDLLDFCQLMVNKHGKCVYVYGLNGDSDRELFGHVHQLLPQADDIRLLAGYCSTCASGEPGIFSAALAKKTKQVMSGAQGVEYATLCRKCYNASHDG